MFFSVYHLATGSQNTCTMIFGRLIPGTATISWQKEVLVSSASNDWCVIPKNINLYNSSFVYFSATFASHSGVYRSSTDGSGSVLFKGFSFVGSFAFLLSYQFIGGFTYVHGYSDSSTFIVKNLLDFEDTSCSSLTILSFSISISDGTASIRDSSSLTNMAYSSLPLSSTSNSASTAAATTSHSVTAICSAITAPSVDNQAVYKGNTLDFNITTPSCSTSSLIISYTAT